MSPCPLKLFSLSLTVSHGQGYRQGVDTETTVVNYTVIHIANSKAKDMANKKHYGLHPDDLTVRGIDCEEAGSI